MQGTPKQFMTWDYSAFQWFCEYAGAQYERTSPTVCTWLDQILERIADGSVTLRELHSVATLIENDIWMDANGAGNLAYKAMSQYGKLPDNVTIAF